MAAYNFDIAFDWNVLPDSDGHLPLEIGLATFNEPVQRGTQYTFNQGDTFCFNAFNQTSGANQSSHSVSSFMISFRRAVDQPATSPVNNTTSITTGSISSTGTGASVVFPGASYPNFCPVLGDQTITNLGDFWFSVSLVVVPGPDGSANTANAKTFKVDPEMIIGTGGTQ